MIPLRIHHLKTWPAAFEAAESGSKNFELRRMDRDFRPGDYAILREWEEGPGDFTGRWVARRIIYVLSAGRFPGLERGYGILGIEPSIPFGAGIPPENVAPLPPEEIPATAIPGPPEEPDPPFGEGCASCPRFHEIIHRLRNALGVEMLKVRLLDAARKGVARGRPEIHVQIEQPPS